MIALNEPKPKLKTDMRRLIAVVSRHRMICDVFAMSATSYGDFHYEIFNDLPSVEKHIADGRLKIDLLLLDTHGTPEINDDQIKKFVGASNPEKVCLLVDPLSVRRNLFWLDCGVSGIIHKSMKVGRAVNAFDLIFTTGYFFPYNCIEVREIPAGLTIKTFTADEFEILELLGKGFSNSEIAREIRKSESTVKSNLLNIFKKFGAKNRTSAVLMARGEGLI